MEFGQKQKNGYHPRSIRTADVARYEFRQRLVSIGVTTCLCLSDFFFFFFFRLDSCPTYAFLMARRHTRPPARAHTYTVQQMGVISSSTLDCPSCASLCCRVRLGNKRGRSESRSLPPSLLPFLFLSFFLSFLSLSILLGHPSVNGVQDIHAFEPWDVSANKSDLFSKQNSADYSFVTQRVFFLCCDESTPKWRRRLNIFKRTTSESRLRLFEGRDLFQGKILRALTDVKRFMVMFPNGQWWSNNERFILNEAKVSHRQHGF